MLPSFAVYLSACLLPSALPHPIGDVYVDQSAMNCGAGNGTLAHPVCTINAGIARAIPGDTIHIAPGTYSETLIIPFDLTLLGTGGDTVTFVDGMGAMESVVSFSTAIAVTIDGLTIQNGGTTKPGGGIQASGALTLRNSTITQNVSTGTGVFYGFYYLGLGGGVFINGGLESVIENCKITDNGAAQYGGGIFCAGSDLTIRSSTISGNTLPINFATNPRGGGLYVEVSDVRIYDSTISNNSAYFGGGLQTSGGDTLLYNSTLSSNVAYRAGTAGLSGYSLFDGVTITANTATYEQAILAGGEFRMKNTIVAGNLTNSGGIPSELPMPGCCFAPPTVVSLGNNLIGTGGIGFVDGVLGDIVGTLQAPVDALLGPLQDNGGPTQTHLPLAGSPAIDAGGPTTFGLFDQRGFVRPSGLAPDIGSVEVADPTTPSFCNGDGGDQMGCTNCPCANNAPAGTIGGCLNSAATSARLVVSGDPSISLPAGVGTDLRFELRGAPPASFCILNSGDALAPTNGVNPCFGMNSGTQAAALDGLRCAVVNTRRHGGRAADSEGQVGITNSPWGGEGAPPAGIAIAGMGFGSGQTRYFQVINRDDALLSCMRGLNTSQAVEVTFQP